MDASHIYYAQLWTRTCIFNLRGRLGTQLVHNWWAPRIPEIAGTNNLVPSTLSKSSFVENKRGPRETQGLQLVAAPMSDVAASAGDVPASSAAMGG